MTSTPQLQQHSLEEAAPLFSMNCEECGRQLAAAERELGAFLTAVQRFYGQDAVAQATNEWITLAEGIQWPSADGRTNWRHITILASSQLAKHRPDQRPTGSSQKGE